MSIIALNIFSHLNIKHFYVLVLVLIYSIGSILVYRKIFSDPELKKFFLDSLRESNKHGCEGKPSGKSLTAFLLSNIMGFATIIAVIYAPHHLLPEYFLICVLSFVASLYGISMASKYFTGGGSGGSGQPQPTQTVTETEEEKEKKKKEEEEKKNNNPDVG